MITVILPVWNGAATIRQAVESVLAQTWRDLELLVVDDGSTDGSVAIVREIADARIRILTQPGNTGVAAARNRGIAEARGELLAFIDADDVWLPHKLAAQQGALRSLPEAGLAYGWVDFVDPRGRRICPDRRPQFTGDVLETLLATNFIVSGSNALMRTEAVRALGGFDVTLACAEDYDLHLRMAEHWPFAVTPAVVTRYRVSPGSASSRLEDMEQCHLRVTEHAFQRAGRRAGTARKHRSLAAFYVFLAVRAAQIRAYGKAARFAVRCLMLSPAAAFDALGRAVSRHHAWRPVAIIHSNTAGSIERRKSSILTRTTHSGGKRI